MCWELISLCKKSAKSASSISLELRELWLVMILHFAKVIPQIVIEFFFIAQENSWNLLTQNVQKWCYLKKWSPIFHFRRRKMCQLNLQLMLVYKKLLFSAKICRKWLLSIKNLKWLANCLKVSQQTSQTVKQSNNSWRSNLVENRDEDVKKWNFQGQNKCRFNILSDGVDDLQQQKFL